MARKSMIVKANREPKFKVRKYTRCQICGRPHSVLKKYGICRICFRNLALKDKYLDLQNQAGKKGGLKMVVSDPIADMLTRIRNANQLRYVEVEMPTSKMKEEIARILKEEGYISDFKVVDAEKQNKLVLNLKYNKKERVITGLKRISKPGLRVYAKWVDIPSVLNGLGIAIVSTSEGVMTGRDAKSKKLGGEVLAYIW